MLPTGSLQCSGSSGGSNKMDLKTETMGITPFMLRNVSKGDVCLQNGLIQDLHEARLYGLAQSLSARTLPLPSEQWPRTGAFSLPMSNVMPSIYSKLNACPPASLVSLDSGSTGSSSRGSDELVGALASNNNVVNVKDLEAEADEFESLNIHKKIKKRRIRRSTLGLKGGKGLRHFSMKVCKKVETKGWTTYNEVASELVAEIVDPNSTHTLQDQQEYDEKNVRRRVYDALNVLMAMDIISKEKKEIRWKGLPTANLNNIEEIKIKRKEVMNRIDRKKAYLQELQEQINNLENLMLRNERAYQTGNNPSGSVTLPFMLVKTRPHATVDIEISEDMQLVHFDFNSTPFELHDDASVLKAMQLNKAHETIMMGEQRSGNESVPDQKRSIFSCILEGMSPSLQ